MKSLQEIYASYISNSDKGTVHTYINEYEHLLQPYRHNSTVLEIGMHLGYSMETWCDYFEDSTIIGVDIINAGIDFTKARYKPIICDATTQEFLAQIKDYRFDVIIDDGSHSIKDQEAAFKLLHPLMKQGGMYVIEDIQDLDSHYNFFSKDLIADIPNRQITSKIIDNRKHKGRYDDVLVLYTFN